MLLPVHTMIFYFFSAAVIAFATMTITAKNPVSAVLFLVATFFASAVLWMLTQAEFLALVLLFVYVGAVMTLFLFVVMMIPISPAESQHSMKRYLPAGLLLLIVLVGTAFYVLSSQHWMLANTTETYHAADYNNTMMMGTLLFTKYVGAFELAAVLLLVGMVSAIALAFHGRKIGTKSQSIAKQVAVSKQDRLRIVDLRDDHS